MLCIGLLTPCKASKTFFFDEQCKQAAESLLLLDYKGATGHIVLAKASKPDNFAPLLMDFHKRAVQVFISENRSDFEALKKELDGYLEQAEGLDSKTPYYLYCQAEMYFFESILRYKFGEHYIAAAHIRKSYKLIQENTKLFPDFLPNKKYTGLIHAAIGMVPDQYKWLTSLAGFDGNLSQGISELQMISEHIVDGGYMQYEQEQANMMLVFIMLNFKQDIPQAKYHLDKIAENQIGPLRTFMRANVAIHAGENDAAIHLLETNRKDNNPVLPYLDYMLGAAKLSKMDSDAHVFLEAFLKTNPGLNYIKAANQKLSWFYLLRKDVERYNYYRERVLTLGASSIDEDKQALTEAQSNTRPNIKLLQARLYFDGGYIKKSLSVFAGSDVKSDFPTLKDQLEVTYRIARIYHRMGQVAKAIEYYQETLKNGYSFSYYFAANASLQLGLVYEEMHDYSKAKFYFDKCLGMRNHEYQNSLDQKAKAGLQRIRVK